MPLAVSARLVDNGSMIVDRAIYTDGRREPAEGPLDTVLARARATDPAAFVWIGLQAPTTDEFTEVSTQLALHPLAVEDAVHAHQRPKLEHYGDVLFLVLKTLVYHEDTSQIETGEIMVFFGERFVITVRHGEHNPLGRVRRHMESDTELLAHGPIAVVYAICDAVVDSYTQITDDVQTDITELEAEVFAPGRVDAAERIYSLKREVLEFERAVGPLVPVTRELAAGRITVPDRIRPFFRDVADHAIRVETTVSSYSELVTSVLNAHFTQVSVRQNEDMRKISAWGAIFAIPTMVTGVYGMNFEHMPGLHWIFSYPLIIAVIVAVCWTLHHLFRRNGWL